MPRTAHAPTLKELCAHLTECGLEQRKFPERLLVVAELPLTPAGKPDRGALRARLNDVRPQPETGTIPRPATGLVPQPERGGIPLAQAG